jgi:hypothetical protein
MQIGCLLLQVPKQRCVHGSDAERAWDSRAAVGRSTAANDETKQDFRRTMESYF